MSETTMAQPLHVPTIEGGRALIVGGTSGVGYAAAEALAELGLGSVVLVGRDAQRGAESVCMYAGQGIAAEFIPADATVAGEATRVVSRCEEGGAIDFVINSTVPTTIPIDLVHRTDIDTFATTLTQFALPPLHVTRAVLPFMRERRGGAIVNVASDAAKVPTPGESVIGAAMAGIVMFSRVTALEARRDGVRVNAVTPALIADTPTTDRVTAGGFSASLFGKAAKAAALGVASARDVADAAVFLCDARSARTTGQVISVNGGISVA